MEHVTRILIIRPNHRLGNMILLTPFVQRLAAAFPRAQIDLLVTGRAASEIFANFPMVTVKFAFPNNSYRAPIQVLRTLGSIRRERYDLAIDPMARSASGRFLLGQTNAQCKLGFLWNNKRRDRCLTIGVPAPNSGAHFSEEPTFLLAGLGQPLGLSSGESVSNLSMRLDDAELLHGRELLQRACGKCKALRSPIVGAYALASGAKNYSAAWWSAVLAHVRRELPEVETLEIVPHDGLPRLSDPLPRLHSTRLRELGGVLASLDVLLTADNGVMHLAAASGTPVVSAFKATDPIRYGPQGPSHLSLEVADHEPQRFAAEAVQFIRSRMQSVAPRFRAAIMQLAILADLSLLAI